MHKHHPTGLFALGLVVALCGCQRVDSEAPLAGYAEAELVYLAPSAAGTLQQLTVQRGDRVSAGQLLYLLDADAERLARESAQAHHARAAATTANLRKGRRPNELAAIDQQLAQARATLAASTATLQRNQQLVEQGFVAPLRLEELLATREHDAARVRELQAQRASAVDAARSDEIAAATADEHGALADLALARWREGQKQRSAPVDALVYDTLFRVGEWVPAGAPVLALLPPGAVKLRFFVPETMLPRAAVGSEVAIACDGCAGGLRARITRVSPQAEYTPPVIYSNESRHKLVFRVDAQPLGSAVLQPGQPVDVRWAPAA
jgi:HlyD family secretion protein